jgi:hypothetical protein
MLPAIATFQICMTLIRLRRFSMLSTSASPMPRVRSVVGALFVALAMLCPAIAQPLSLDTNSPQDLQIKVGTADLSVEIRIHNSGGEDRQIAFGSQLYKTGEQTSVVLTSTRPGGSGAVVTKGGGDARFALHATLPEPGTYVGTLDVLSADGAKIVHAVKLNVAREGQPVPATLIVAPGALTVTWPWSLLSPSQTSVRLRNESSKPIAIGTPNRLSFSDASGAADSEGVKLDGKDCADRLLREGTSCAVKVTLDKPLWPGTYSLDVGVGGAAGGWSQQTLTISAGLSIVVAFLVAAAGVWVGVVVDEWRKRGRPLVDSMIKLTTLKENLDKAPFRPAHKPELKVAVEMLRQDVGRWLDRIVDVPPDDAAIASLQSRYDRLVQASLLVDALDCIGNDGRRVLEPRVQALIGQLTDPQLADAQTAKLATTARVVAEDLQRWPQARAEAHRAGNLLGGLSVFAESDNAAANFGGTLAAIRKPVDDARAALLKPLATGLADADLADTIAKRTASLSDALWSARETGVAVADKAAAVLNAGIVNFTDPKRSEYQRALKAVPAANGPDWTRRLLSLAELWPQVFPPKQTPTEALAAGTGPAQDGGNAAATSVGELRVDFIGGLWGLTADQMRERRAFYQWWWNGAVTGLFALGLATASIAPTWGSAADIAKLFLAGVGARLALAAVTNK